MTRYLLQMRSRAEEETRVHSLPLDQPLNSYGLHTLLMSSKPSTRITTALEAAREEVNIFAWRARQDCLPTRVNLIRRGITIESSLCPVCSVCEEDVCHIFFRCDLAQLVLRRICRWWGLDPHDWSSFQEWQSWILSIQFSSKVKAMLEGVKMRYADETEDIELEVAESQSKLTYANDTQNVKIEAADSPANLNSKGAKRKEYKERSRVWIHFTKYFDNNDKPRAKCNYCGMVYSGDTKSGTFTLWGHLNKCESNPTKPPTDQTHLAFNITRVVETGEMKHTLQAWKFDQQKCRNAIAEMIIIVELPLKMHEDVPTCTCCSIKKHNNKGLLSIVC
ncbi:RNA-directed DNA polymerase, eukaryota [Tanacetum coccineum]